MNVRGKVIIDYRMNEKKCEALECTKSSENEVRNVGSRTGKTVASKRIKLVIIN